jgi:peptidoglycan/LPS O-acetylase OafA/YrhL
LARQLLPIPDWSKRIPALDGLRGIAILMVLLHHGVFNMKPDSKVLATLLSVGELTWSGVDLFFVLSGFLIGGILLDVINSPRYFQTFYIRRAYRIFPLYGVVIGVFFLRHLPLHLVPGALGNVSPMAIPWYAYVTMTQNWWMAYIGWAGPRALIVTWSLAVEEQFYLTAPFVIRKLRAAKLIVVLVAIVIGAPLLRQFLFSRVRDGAFACYILTPCRADALCLGVLCALLVRNSRGWNWLQTQTKTLHWLIGILFAGVIFMTFRHYEQPSHFMVTVGYSWLALFYAGCLLVIVSGTSNIAQRLLCNSKLMWLGTLAYCTYLIHLPFNEAFRRLFSMHSGIVSPNIWLAGGVAGSIVAILVASISWRIFEKPLLQRGHLHQY